MVRQTSAFYEPGLPPPPIPALTAHTIIRHMSAPPTIIAQEEVVPRSNQAKPSTPRPRTPTPESLPKVRFDSKLSHHNSVTSSHHTSSRESSATASESDLTTISSGDESREESREGSISKPEGEPGKPGCGGYNLKRAARLKNFDEVKKFVSKLIEDSSDIDTRRSYKKQDPHAFSSIYDDAKDRFPELSSFDKCWPVDDMLKTYLKNSSSKWRKAQSKNLLKKGLIKSMKKREKKKKSHRTPETA